MICEHFPCTHRALPGSDQRLSVQRDLRGAAMPRLGDYEAQPIRGINLMRVCGGRIVDAFGDVKA